jgi:hypothetical protein
VAPLPACLEFLPARRTETLGTMRSLHEEQIWKLVFPSFDLDKRVLPPNAPTCTGQDILADPTFRGGSARGWPFQEHDGDIDFGSGGDRIKVAWLKVFTWPDGSIGGPLALVRANERFADLFAVGALHGWPDRTKLGAQRLGDDILITSEEDDCTGHKPGVSCESHLVILLARGGTLKRAVDIASERVAYYPSTEKEVSGILEYRLTTAIDYKADGVHLTEQIQVSDEAGRPLRKAEVDRPFALDDRTATLSTLEPPLWDRFAPTGPENHPPAEKKAPEKKDSKPPRHR